MISEELEFQISQYVDGTLPAAEMKSVDNLVQSSSEAQKVLADYLRLNRKLITLRNPGAIRFDQLADHISAKLDHVDQSGTATVVGRIGFFVSRWRVAAAVLIVAGGVMVAKHAMRASPVPLKVVPPSALDVTGPQADVATGPAVQDVTVGPSPALAARDSRYGEGVIGEGPPKVILGQLPKAAPDPRLH